MPNDPVAQAVCIAVLPFENLSRNRDNDYFERGFVEDVITDLAHFHNLQVISSYTSRKLGTDNGDALSAAKKLSIDYLLKGDLRRQSETIRITTQLIGTPDGRVLWAERYEASVDTIFEIQDDMVARVVGALSTQIDKVLLTAARKKPLTNLEAYDCWLRGMDYLLQGSRDADRKARSVFKQAIELDPSYSRAYAGLSLSYFNDWSCQFWEQWEITERNAYNYAVKASRLDDTDHMVQMILGRILLYRRQFDLAEQHLNKSLTLNANDADCLAQIATGKAFLGKPGEGKQLFQKALRLNPYRNLWYYPYGAFTSFVQRQYEDCINLALKGPLTEVWVDLPGFIAAAYAYMDNRQQAEHYLDIFMETFHKEIISDHRSTPREIVNWLLMANPFKENTDAQHMIDGLVKAGLPYSHDNNRDDYSSAFSSVPNTMPNRFIKGAELWQICFEDKEIQIPGVKGFFDLAQMLSSPGKEYHCTQLMGSTIKVGDEQLVIDDKARNAYERRIIELQTEISEARDMNDLDRCDRMEKELDQLTDHLSKALGLGGRSRKINVPVERARAAVTWRIRSAIGKISAAHPALGKHLGNSIHTGTFCHYSPEKEHAWKV